MNGIKALKFRAIQAVMYRNEIMFRNRKSLKVSHPWQNFNHFFSEPGLEVCRGNRTTS